GAGPARLRAPATALWACPDDSARAQRRVSCQSDYVRAPAPPAQSNPGGGSEGAAQAPFDELVSPMPIATATLASRRSRVRDSPPTSAAAITPKIGWVRKNAASALGR